MSSSLLWALHNGSIVGYYTSFSTPAERVNQIVLEAA
jgi:hypothetical protein